MICCFTVDDVGYEGYSTEAHLEQLLIFLSENSVKGTFFVVPLCNGTPLGSRPGYVRLLTAAMEEGHEIGQHGLEHDRFECGIPPQMILALPHEKANRERVDRERNNILAGLTVEVIRKRLAQGRRILEDALGTSIRCFRAPALSICDNLFTALEAEGFTVDSSRHFQEAGWDLLIDKAEIIPSPITRDIFQSWQGNGMLKELPLTADYTWYLPTARFNRTLDLARHDLNACGEAGIPLVPLCHVSPLFEGENENGLAFYRQLFDIAHQCNGRSKKPAQWVTLSEAAAAVDMD